MARSGINRGLMWLRKTLEINEETESPQVLSELLRPVIDVFGWERLPEEQFSTNTQAQPGVAIASGTPAEGILRVVFGASLEHTDTGASHVAWLLKRRNPGPLDVGLPTDRINIAVGEFLSMQGRTFLIENDFVVAEMLVAPAAGQMTLRLNFVDLPIGEYIRPL